jgi:HPt (histidine-containing phosphotransfer) domain-containing protein
MFTLIVIGIFVLIIAIVIYFEYKNEKDYQENRRKRAEERKKTKPPYHPKEKIQKPLKEKNEKAAQRRAATPGAKEKPLPQVKKEKTKTTDDTYALKDEKKYVVEPRKVPSAQEIREAEEKEKLKAKRLEEEKVELESIPEPEVVEKIDLPECKYPKFNYSRLLEMGLGEDEAIEFVKELIPQIKTQIPLIKESMEASDFHNIERLTHSIKGSSTTVGSGGISDLLVEFNTYVKTGKEIPIIEAYVKHLNHYCEELEKEYA